MGEGVAEASFPCFVHAVKYECIQPALAHREKDSSGIRRVGMVLVSLTLESTRIHRVPYQVTWDHSHLRYSGAQELLSIELTEPERAAIDTKKRIISTAIYVGSVVSCILHAPGEACVESIGWVGGVGRSWGETGCFCFVAFGFTFKPIFRLVYMYHKGFLLDPGKRHTFRKGKRTRPKHTAGAKRRLTPRSITPTQERAGSTAIARKRVVTETEINNPFREAERPAKPVSIT